MSTVTTLVEITARPTGSTVGHFAQGYSLGEYIDLYGARTVCQDASRYRPCERCGQLTKSYTRKKYCGPCVADVKAETDNRLQREYRRKRRTNTDV